MKNCLSSLENQTVLPDEVIIGDDCSTDDSYFRLSEYAQTAKFKVIVFKNEENKGPGYTRNRAKDYVTSNYVAFCDCDDWYELNFVEKVLTQIAETGSDLILFDNYKIFGGKKERANITSKMLYTDKKTILALYPMSLCRFVVSENMIHTIEFPALYNGEDGAVAPQFIAQAQQISIIDQPLYNYFTRLDSASVRVSKKAFQNMIAAFEIVENSLGKNYSLESEFLGIKMVCHGATLNGLKARIGFPEIKKIISKFEHTHPNWYHNPYINSLGKTKRIYLFFVKQKRVLYLLLFSKLHSLLIFFQIKIAYYYSKGIMNYANKFNER